MVLIYEPGVTKSSPDRLAYTVDSETLTWALAASVPARMPENVLKQKLCALDVTARSGTLKAHYERCIRVLERTVAPGAPGAREMIGQILAAAAMERAKLGTMVLGCVGQDRSGIDQIWQSQGEYYIVEAHGGPGSAGDKPQAYEGAGPRGEPADPKLTARIGVAAVFKACNHQILSSRFTNAVLRGKALTEDLVPLHRSAIEICLALWEPDKAGVPACGQFRLAHPWTIAPTAGLNRAMGWRDDEPLKLNRVLGVLVTNGNAKLPRALGGTDLLLRTDASSGGRVGHERVEKPAEPARKDPPSTREPARRASSLSLSLNLGLSLGPSPDAAGAESPAARARADTPAQPSAATPARKGPPSSPKPFRRGPGHDALLIGPRTRPTANGAEKADKKG